MKALPTTLNHNNRIVRKVEEQIEESWASSNGSNLFQVRAGKDVGDKI
jgi:hypothetical protein